VLIRYERDSPRFSENEEARIEQYVRDSVIRG